LRLPRRLVTASRSTASRLAIFPATSHTAVITQVGLLHPIIEQFLRGETPKSFFGGN